MRKATNKLTLIYYCIYFVAVLLAIGGYYYMNQKEALMEEHSQNATTITSIYLIYLVASIPLSLKFFNSAAKKLANIELNNEEKIKKYTQYSFLRLLAISISLFIGIILFYALSSRSMIYCAGIAAVALVFCKPSEVKMANDLNINEED